MAYYSSGEYIARNEEKGLGLKFKWNVIRQTNANTDEGETYEIQWSFSTTEDSTYTYSGSIFKTCSLKLLINGSTRYVGGGNYTSGNYYSWSAGYREIWSNPILEYLVVKPNSTTGDGSLSISINFTTPDETIISESFEWDLNPFARQATLSYVPSFNDEEGLTITYRNPAGDRVTSLQACISLNGSNDDIEYRDVPKTATSYTFDLQGYELMKLYDSIPTERTREVTVYLRTEDCGQVFYSSETTSFTIVEAKPYFLSTVINADEYQNELTGSDGIIIKGHNRLQYNISAGARKGATIVSQSLTCGGKTYTQPTGELLNLDTNTFTFTATDSRGWANTHTLTLPMVEYFPPTITQDVKMSMGEPAGEAAIIDLTINGTYFNETFGAVHNNVKLEVKFATNGEEYRDWDDLTPLMIESSGNTYSLTTQMTSNTGVIEYDKSYTFICRVTDLLTEEITSEYTVALKPVFDWGQEDFNFNVPISMNDEVILRHTGAVTNNTVLSASGGHIYIRPAGTSSTSGEIKITPQGNIVLTGDIVINGVSLKSRLGIS